MLLESVNARVTIYSQTGLQALDDELSIHELAEEVVSVSTTQTGGKFSNASSDKVEMVRW